MSSEHGDEKNNELSKTMERWSDGTVMFKAFRPCAHFVSDLTVRDSDVWVVTFPKSGTTWTQEIVWLLTNNLDFDTAKRIPLTKRTRFLEFPSMSFSGLATSLDVNRWFGKIETSRAPRRNFKSHLTWAILPKQLQNPDTKAKIVYVARNPKDVCVSFCNFIPKMVDKDESVATENLEDFADRILTDRVYMTPYWAHIKAYWSRRNQANVLFLWYEDMKKDLSKEIDKMVRFLEVPSPSPDDMSRLLEHASFDSMKKNPSVNEASPGSTLKGGEKHGIYVQEGKVGAWKKKMTQELSAHFDSWILQNTAGTDLEEIYSFKK